MRFSLVIVLFVIPLLCEAQKHVFYLHGRIVELQGLEAYDSEYGKYDYKAIIDTLQKAGFVVHSEIRPPSTEVNQYAAKIKLQIDSLLANKVNASDITVIGASKGSMIAMLASALCKNDQLNFVFMAACNPYLAKDLPNLEFYGNVLSIFEKSDVFGSSCLALKEKSTHVRNYRELQLNTGLKHGFIYRPLAAWMEPACAWARGAQKN